MELPATGTHDVGPAYLKQLPGRGIQDRRRRGYWTRQPHRRAEGVSHVNWFHEHESRPSRVRDRLTLARPRSARLEQVLAAEDVRDRVVFKDRRYRGGD